MRSKHNARPSFRAAPTALSALILVAACSSSGDDAPLPSGVSGSPSPSPVAGSGSIGASVGGAGVSAGGSDDASMASARGGMADAVGGTSTGGASGATGTDIGRAGANSSAGGPVGGSANGGQAGTAPVIAGCAVFPASHVFNTAIDTLPVHAASAAFMATIGTHKIHLDLGTSVNPVANDYYGIPYNVVHSKAVAWANAAYATTDTANLNWDPTTEADCAAGSTHTLTSPCTAAAAPKPQFPIPSVPLVEGGIVTDPAQPYGDHHVLLLDADTCGLWELYHVYPDAKGGWDIFGSAFFDLRSNKLRPAGWTSADAAGFPILPLLLRAEEASSGRIAHALRFTIDSNKIRKEYTWPARHLTSNGTTSTNLPPMGQAFRIKSSFVIPASYNSQSRAILQALKTYGMYLADGGSALFLQGEPSSGWQASTFDQVQSVSSTEFEAVDLTPISKRAGFDANSAAVP